MFKRPELKNVIKKLKSVKNEICVIYDPVLVNAWKTLNNRYKDQRINVDERTMCSKNSVQLTSMYLNAQNAPNITDQKMSNLCVYFATVSAVCYEMKKIFGNLKSTAVNMDSMNFFHFFIPAGKSIDELFKQKKFSYQFRQYSHQFSNRYRRENFPNALSFEIMLTVLISCVSPRALSGLVKTINIPYRIKGCFSYFNKQ